MSNPKLVIPFVAVFALIGGYLLFRSFADTPATYLVGMGSGGAIAASNDANGNVQITGPSAAFQITPDNILQCTNVNSGDITTVQLTADQTSNIANQVIAAGISSQSDTVDANGNGVLSNTWVTVNTNGVNKTVNIVGNPESTEFGRAVKAVAKDACKLAKQPFKGHQVSQASSSKPMTKSEGQALARKIEDAINAKLSTKVYADGFGVERETANYVGINYFRDINGVTRNLLATSCLRESARLHSQDMAAYDTMSHQLPNESFVGVRIDNQCGKNSWIYAGENIGWNSDTSLNGVARLVDYMASEKPPENGHRLNMLSPNYTSLGAGVYVDYVHHKVWVTEDFASFNYTESTFTPTPGWGLDGTASVSSSTAAAASTIYAAPGQTVAYHFRIANTGPSTASYAQYSIQRHYSASGVLLSTASDNAPASQSTGWGAHGDAFPATTTSYSFSGRYYNDFTDNSTTQVIPSTALNGEKFCHYVHYNSAFGPGILISGTSTEDSNMACAIVKR